MYKSKDDQIKVRALVGLCKLSASAGHDASMRPFADGSTTKLGEACRRILINPGQDLDMRRFVCLFVCFIYLVLKHYFQGLVKDLNGSENKNRNIDINYKINILM